MPAPDPEASDDDLIRRAITGDQSAWDALCARHGNRLHEKAARRLRPLLGPRVGASDVVQEVWVQLLRAPPRLDPANLSGSAWLDAVVNNMVRRAVEWHWETAQRTAKRDVHDSGVVSNLPARSNQRTPSSDAARQEEIARTNVAIASLDEDDRDVVRLRTWDDLTFPAIAEIMGKSDAAVRMQYQRALVKLHGLLKDDGQGAV